AETAPWALAKDPANADRLSGVLFDVAEAIRVGALLLLPVMPRSAAEILRRVGDTTSPVDLRFDRDAQWRTGGERTIVKDAALGPRAEEDPRPATVTRDTTSSAAGPAPRVTSKEPVVEEKRNESAAPAAATPVAGAPVPAGPVDSR